MPHRFADEIRQLRDLGFAEGLLGSSVDAVVRLESGERGVAVEFAPRDARLYRLVPLTPAAGGVATLTSEHWGDVVQAVRARIRSQED